MRIPGRRLVPLYLVCRKEAHIHFHAGRIATAQKLGQLATLYPESGLIAMQQRRLHRRLPKQFKCRAPVRSRRLHFAPFLF